jgi:hypothetical protein
MRTPVASLYDSSARTSVATRNGRVSRKHGNCRPSSGNDPAPLGQNGPMPLASYSAHCEQRHLISNTTSRLESHVAMSEAKNWSRGSIFSRADKPAMSFANWSNLRRSLPEQIHQTRLETIRIRPARVTAYEFTVRSHWPPLPPLAVHREDGRSAACLTEQAQVLSESIAPPESASKPQFVREPAPVRPAR